ncbi:hypothetical protein T05_9985 [Trichinella murrelli]|uniref:Uncharacterized protein n=1 Tax=Trichinella murrelli TaxID=144512 RepID=A0A0V0UC23_9BILA|nr:hypothetical protein T05_9985 [Trichinella murrelli]
MGNVNWTDWIGVNEMRERGRLKIFTHQWKESIKLIRRVRLDDRPTGCLGVQLTREIKLTVNVRAHSSTNQRSTSDRRICITKQRISVNDTAAAAAADFKRRKRMKRFFFLLFHSHPSENLFKNDDGPSGIFRFLPHDVLKIELAFVFWYFSLKFSGKLQHPQLCNSHTRHDREIVDGMIGGTNDDVDHSDQQKGTQFINAPVFAFAKPKKLASAGRQALPKNVYSASFTASSLNNGLKIEFTDEK